MKITNSKPTEAFLQGHAAFYQGYDTTDNPYSISFTRGDLCSTECLEWLEGFRKAWEEKNG